MARRTRVTTWYARQLGRVVKPRSERSLAISRTVNTLTAADELPGPSDFGEVMLLTVTTEPPIPLDDDPRPG